MEQSDTSPPVTPARAEEFRKELGALVVAAETTLLATAFTDGDPDNSIIFANDAFLALTGFSHADILGTPLNHLLGNVTDSSTISLIRSAAETDGSGSWETQCRRGDGTEYLAALFLSSVPAKDGKRTRNVLTMVALGGHVERLLDQRNEFHALYEQAPGFIATSQGPEHRFTFANASYKKFVGREQLVGATVAEALPDVIEQGFIALLDSVYRTGDPFIGNDMMLRFVDPVGGAVHVRYCNFVYQAVRDASGRINGLFCEGYDVSEQHATAAALAALQSDIIHVSRVNAMGTMATTLAHELNQPLSAIANYTAGVRRLADAEPTGGPLLAEALQGIEEATQRAAEIIRNLRELTDRREPARVPFDLQGAVRECVRMVRATAPPSVSIVETIPDGMTIAADRVQIQQVVINLLRNACDAALESNRQRVEIGAHAGGEVAVVCVEDTGRGVPIEAAQNIFSWSDSVKEGGMGLGLSICRTIIEAHHGRIWLEHSGPEGSEFRFCIPIAPPTLPGKA